MGSVAFMAVFPLWFGAMDRLDIYICTKSKCTARVATLKLRSGDKAPHSYNGPALFEAIRALIVQKNLNKHIEVHEAACMSGCPVGPRVDMVVGARRVMYFQRQTPTGREDLISWGCVDSVESAIEHHLREL
jgi:predicted metal-binding protein